MVPWRRGLAVVGGITAVAVLATELYWPYNKEVGQLLWDYIVDPAALIVIGINILVNIEDSLRIRGGSGNHLAQWPRDVVTVLVADQRQLLLPVDDNYSCRSSGVTIWYRRYRIGYRSAGNGTEAEANGRQESASVGRGIGDERADVTDVASRQGAIGEEGQETVANSTGPVRRGMGRGGRAPSAERR